MPFEEREFFEMELGSELIEEVIEYDKTLPGWKGRRVVEYRRLDMRDDHFQPIEPLDFNASGDNAKRERASFSISHGRFYPGEGAEVGSSP